METHDEDLHHFPPRRDEDARRAASAKADSSSASSGVNCRKLQVAIACFAVDAVALRRKGGENQHVVSVPCESGLT